MWFLLQATISLDDDSGEGKSLQIIESTAQEIRELEDKGSEHKLFSLKIFCLSRKTRGN